MRATSPSTRRCRSSGSSRGKQMAPPSPTAACAPRTRPERLIQRQEPGSPVVVHLRTLVPGTSRPKAAILAAHAQPEILRIIGSPPTEAHPLRGLISGEEEIALRRGNTGRRALRGDHVVKSERCVDQLKPAVWSSTTLTRRTWASLLFRRCSIQASPGPSGCRMAGTRSSFKVSMRTMTVSAVLAGSSGKRARAWRKTSANTVSAPQGSAAPAFCIRAGA
mmetsp:Transcript_51689/g.165441  ORF Transcript_51689/g.165441 Transcript_51689/m.165441 type:complete len:221 (+) Transcript_51689:34-696(+)